MATPSQCEDQIYSEDYVDYIIDYNASNESIRQLFDNACVQYINELQAIVYEKYTGESFLVGSRGYRSFPACYGLQDSQVMIETGILRLRRQPFFNLYGRGILYAVIDTGIDYRHKAFIREDGTSRIVAAWNQQDRSGTPPDNILYGSEYTGEDFNRALENGGSSAGAIEQIAEGSAHGTAIAGIGCGREDVEAGFSGAAPLADIVVVKLKEAKNIYREYYRIPDTVAAFQENDIMMAVTYVLGVAARRRQPVVICLGIGTNQGDHNGTGPLADYLNLISVNANIYVCVAAGNETGKEHHYRSNILESDEYVDVSVVVEGRTKGFCLELWGDIGTLYAASVKPPLGGYTGIIEARFNEQRTFDFILNDTRLEVSAEIIEGSSGDELLFFRFVNPAEGLWTIRVFQRGILPGAFDMWLPLEEFIEGSVRFLEADPNITICEPGNADNVMTFAGSNVKGDSLYINSSRGYTRYGRIKPDITAPAVEVYTTVPGGNYREYTGTSMAAAVGAGATALFAEWSLNNLIIPSNNTTAKKYLIRGADTENIEVPERGWGWGRLDLYATFLNIS